MISRSAVFAFVLCLTASSISAQDQELDSLKKLTAQAAPQQAADIWYIASESFMRSKPAITLALGKWIIDAAEQKNDQLNIGRGYEQMGNGYYYLRKADSSIWAYKEAFKRFSSINDNRKIFSVYNHMVYSFRLVGNSDSSNFYVDQELTIARATRDSSDLALAMYDDAFRLTEQNKLNKAISIYFSALKISRKHDYETKIKINNGIGDCYNITGNDSISMYFFEASKELALQAPVHKDQKAFMLSAAYNRLASGYLELKKPTEARPAIDEQLRAALECRDLESQYKAFLNYGIYYTQAKKYDSSEFAFQKCLAIQKIVGRKRAIGIIHHNMAGLFNEIGKYDRALIHSDSADRIFAAINNQSWQTENYYNLAVALAGVGRSKEGFSILDKYVKSNQELMTEDNNQRIAQMQAEYDVEKKDAAIALLNAENELQGSQRNLLIAASIALLIIACLCFYLFLQKKKNNSMLIEKNATIEKALQEREALLKEIHHRVKNNLQIISSLLSLQSKNVGDDAAKGAISESRNRVKSMSLIHEQLYQEDTISGVEMHDYISRLVNSLTSSYGLNTDQVEVNIDSDNLLLDVDSAIPLGLIINELVSNSIKYAFPQQQQGMILISLKEMMNELQLVVKDSGVGLNLEAKSQQSFGLSMVNSLMRKLKAEMKIINDKGTTIELVIRDFKKVSFA